MKHINKLILCLLLLSLVFMMTGCVVAGDDWETSRQNSLLLGDSLDDPQLREKTITMLDSIIADDFESAYLLVSKGISQSEFQTPYQQIRTLLADIGSYELLASNKQGNNNLSSGITTLYIRYMLTAGETRLLVDVGQSSEYPEGLISFHVSTYEPVTQTGSLTTMKEANAIQWVLLIIFLLEAAFIIWMFIDCCCHKMQKKWLWLLIIALGSFTFGLHADSGIFRFLINWGLSLGNYTSLILYSTGGFTFRFLIPVGAVTYVFIRKELFRKYQLAQQAPIPQFPAEQSYPIPSEIMPAQNEAEESASGEP